MAIDFNGIDSIVTIKDSADFDFTGDFAISVWFNSNNLTTSRFTLFHKGYYTVGENGNFIVSVKNDKIEFITYDGQSNYEEVDLAVALSTDTSYHLVISRTGSTVTMYVDGSSIGTGTITKSIGVNASDLIIGDDPNAGNQPWDGQLTEIDMWNNDLTQEHVDQLYNSKIKYTPLQIQGSNLVMHLSMDDGPDGSSANGTNNIIDRSASGNHGSGVNGPVFKAERVLSYPVGVMPMISSAVISYIPYPRLSGLGGGIGNSMQGGIG